MTETHQSESKVEVATTSESGSVLAMAIVSRGQIARALDADPIKVTYILEKHNRSIRPIGSAGTARLYSSDAIELVRVELQKLQDKRDRWGRPRTGPAW